MGRVNKPGNTHTYIIPDVLRALSLAGGLTPFASENDIKIIRREEGRNAYFFRYGDIQKGR
ncbi:MAG: hypothetical protein U0361_02825 [Nitrospiraceae bacterium]